MKHLKQIRHLLHPARLYIKYFPQRILLFIYSFIPIKKHKLVFSNFSGKRCGDSPFAIFEYLQKRHPEWDYVWLSNPEYNPQIPEGARSVPFESKKMIYELATSSVWIDSHYKHVYIRKRKKQLFIQTWHGGIALKSDVLIDSGREKDFTLQKRKLNFHKLADYVITDSKFTTENFQSNFFVTNNYLQIGAPCDDIFFSNFNSNKLKESLGIPLDKKIVLYCPTWRASGDVNCYNFDKEKLLTSLNKRFNSQWVLVVRLHPLVMKDHPDLFQADNQFIFDSTNHQAVNEILFIADILITDYSGVMGTYMNTSRPLFLYQKDYKKYLDERELSFTKDELPFPISTSDEELQNSILNFDEEKYKEDLKQFKQKLGFVENNNATEKVCSIIENFIETGKKSK